MVVRRINYTRLRLQELLTLDRKSWLFTATKFMTYYVPICIHLRKRNLHINTNL